MGFPFRRGQETGQQHRRVGAFGALHQGQALADLDRYFRRPSEGQVGGGIAPFHVDHGMQAEAASQRLLAGGDLGGGRRLAA